MVISKNGVYVFEKLKAPEFPTNPKKRVKTKKIENKKVKVFKRTEYYLAGKFKSVPDPSFIVVRSPHKKLTRKQRERKFNKKHGIAWYPSFPISEARTKAYSYGIRNGT